MNDNDIIKALEDSIHKMKECCVTNWDFYASGDFVKNILDLINRQKAEIERLNIRKNALTDITKNYDWKFEKAKSEAIKEFAERLKERSDKDGWTDSSEIDALLEEMVGDTE